MSETKAEGAITRRPRQGRPLAAESLAIDERIKASALDLFLERSFDDVRIDSIAANAGITKRTLYARYANKEELFREVLNWALVKWSELNLDITINLDKQLTLEQKLIRAAQILLERELNIKVVQLGRIAVSQRNRLPDAKPASEDQNMSWSPRLQAISAILEQHVEAGEIVVDDLNLFSELFISLIMGIPARLAAFGRFRDPEFEQQRIKKAVRLFLAGIIRA